MLLSVSCNNDLETINIEWVVLGDIADIGFFERLEVHFRSDSGDRTSFRLRPNKTSRIRLQRDMELSSWRMWVGAFGVRIYPTEVPGWLDIWDYGAMEIILHQLWRYERTENSIILVPDEKIALYFYFFFRNNRQYYVFSRNNEISLDLDNITRINTNEHIVPSRIFEIMGEKEIDACYFYLYQEELLRFIYLEERGIMLSTPLSRDSTRGYLVESRLGSTKLKPITNIGIWVEI